MFAPRASSLLLLQQLAPFVSSFLPLRWYGRKGQLFFDTKNNTSPRRTKFLCICCIWGTYLVPIFLNAINVCTATMFPPSLYPTSPPLPPCDSTAGKVRFFLHKKNSTSPKLLHIRPHLGNLPHPCFPPMRSCTTDASFASSLCALLPYATAASSFLLPATTEQ